MLIEPCDLFVLNANQKSESATVKRYHQKPKKILVQVLSMDSQPLQETIMLKVFG